MIEGVAGPRLIRLSAPKPTGGDRWAWGGGVGRVAKIRNGGTMVRMGTMRSRPAGEEPDSIAARLACDFGAKTVASRAIAALAAPLGPAAPPELARQTWYLLAVKLLVGETLAVLAGRPSPAAALSRAQGQFAVRTEIEAVEHGPFLRQLHDGLPESDRYSWYLNVWSPEIAQAVRDLAARLTQYPPQAIARIPASGHDLFKPLYEALFPRTLRHAQGEYYTPDWLAEHVLDEVGYCGEPGGRLLDPASAAALS